MKCIKVILFLSSLFALTSCVEENTIIPQKKYKEGVFVVNEGLFGQTSGTISFFDRTTKSVSQRIFKAVNGRDLGDIVQSLSVYDNEAFIVVNNSNKIEVVDAKTFEEKAEIVNLKMPRYILPISANKAYVSEWGADGLTGTIAILDLNTYSIIGRIEVGKGPEGLLFKFGKLYVSHLGGYGTNNIITVINTSNDEIETTITVLDKPSICLSDVDGNLWVACSGNVEYTSYPTIDTVNSTMSGLVQISPSTNAVLQTVSFGKGASVQHLTINTTNKKDLYYTKAQQVWKYDIATGVEEAIISGNFYGLGFDPKLNYLYTASFSGIDAAFAKRWQTDGILVDSFQVGVFANSFVFE